MYAQCPECLTFFRLKPAHLKAAQGRVRCSRCKHVFNALETLRDDLTADEIAAVHEARGREPKPDAPLLNEDQVGDLFDGLDYTENAELNLDTPEASDAVEDAGSRPEDLSPEARDAAEAAQLAAAPGPVLEREAQPDQLAAPAREVNAFEAPRRRQRHPVLVGIANVLLILLLVVQIVHWQRLAILDHPVAGPWLAAIYARLDIDPQAAPDLAALNVSRTEVSSHPDHPRALHLTALLENQSPLTQPWPQLRVDLQDRWGETVGARYFEPSEYLREPDAARQRLQANARFPIQLAILDPGNAAVGFQIEPCFEAGDGHVCSADLVQ